MKGDWLAGALAAALIGACASAAAQNVKITPLGTHAGELCNRDRATIFEDQTGVRILYDAGQSVLGAGDPRLGRIAYITNELVQPAAVLATHVNEAATVDGKVRPGSRTATFMSLVKGRPVYPALSGKTLEFSGEGKCVAGC